VAMLYSKTLSHDSHAEAEQQLQQNSFKTGGNSAEIPVGSFTNKNTQPFH